MNSLHRAILKRIFYKYAVKTHYKTRLFTTTQAVKSKLPDDDYVEVEPPPDPSSKPISRTYNILKHDIKSVFDPNLAPYSEFSTHVDICIIGGGVVGSSIAYWIKQRLPKDSLSVMVIERDPAYTRSSSVLSVGGLRQQFSLKENVEMAMFGAEFLRKAPKLLSIHDAPPLDIRFQPFGSLVLADESGAQEMQENWLMQKECGAHVELLGKEKLKARFPWLNTDGIELACHGVQNEGWFDPWAFLFGLKRKAISMGTEYVEAEVIGFEFEDSYNLVVGGSEEGEKQYLLDKVIVQTPKGEKKSIRFAYCILAGGHESGKIAEMARIGRGKEMMSVPLPVEPRKRYMYCVHAPDGPGLDCPLVIDPKGAHFRREGYAGHFLAGQSPPLTDEPNIENLEVDYNYFNNTVYPNIVNRVPSFKNLQVKSAWAGYYDYNSFDQNAIIGPHPYLHRMYLACGFSGNGIQLAPAIGRATMEMILDGEFKSIDLSRFLFERFIVGREIKEKIYL